VTRAELGLELVAHRLVSEEVVSLAREKPTHRYLVVLVRLDAELAAMMPVRNESLVELLNRERQGQIFRMTMPDVADESMKYAV
jgi:hypothetical protein